jgi:hypothetical protein
MYNALGKMEDRRSCNALGSLKVLKISKKGILTIMDNGSRMFYKDR